MFTMKKNKTIGYSECNVWSLEEKINQCNLIEIQIFILFLFHRKSEKIKSLHLYTPPSTHSATGSVICIKSFTYNRDLLTHVFLVVFEPLASWHAYRRTSECSRRWYLAIFRCFRSNIYTEWYILYHTKLKIRVFPLLHLIRFVNNHTFSRTG